MGWVPNGSKLHLKYSEDWVDQQDSREFTADVEFGSDEKPKVTSAKLSVQTQTGTTLVVEAPQSAATQNPMFITVGGDGWDKGKFERMNKSLKKITLTGSLEVKLGGGTFAAQPEKDGDLYTPPIIRSQARAFRKETIMLDTTLLYGPGKIHLISARWSEDLVFCTQVASHTVLGSDEFRSPEKFACSVRHADASMSNLRSLLSQEGDRYVSQALNNDQVLRQTALL